MSWILEEIIKEDDPECWHHKYYEFETKEAAEEFGVNNLITGITKHFVVYHS